MQKWLMLDSKWLSAHARPLPPRGKFHFRAYVPRKWPEPVLVADKPWEAMVLAGHTLLYDSGRYRLWYGAGDRRVLSRGSRLCYAESDDLSHWRKPELGLVEYQGSKRNNIVSDDKPGFHPLSICVDPLAPPTERYRMIAVEGSNPLHRTLVTAHSPDGLTWRVSTNRPLLENLSEPLIVAFWDPGLRKFIGFFPTWEANTRASRPARVRCIGRSETDDFNRWPQPVTVRAPDEADGPHASLYNTAVWRYESSGDVAYGMMIMPAAPSLELQLATSRDSVSWQRLSRETILKGGPAAWDAQTAFPCSTLVPFRDGLALSYGGASTRRPGSPPVASVGFVEYPLDRFQGLWTEELEATCASFVMDEKLPRLRVNAAIQPGGEVRGALLIDGKAVPGCDFHDCAPVTGDVLGAELDWKTKAPPLQHRDREIQLRLQLRKACLYAIEKV